jgi:hypothetical protein
MLVCLSSKVQPQPIVDLSLANYKIGLNSGIF